MPLHCPQCQRSYTCEGDFLKSTAGWCLSDQDELWFDCSCGHRLQTPKDKQAWYSPTKFMSDEAACVFETLERKDDIPHIHHAVMEFQKALRDPNQDANSLAKILKDEPLLATEILAQANTLKVVSIPKIESLAHALTYLGYSVVGEIALLASIRSFRFKTKVFSPEAFWGQATLTGVLSEKVCSQFAPHLSQDMAYLAGALCNVGKIIGAMCLPQTIDTLFSKIESPRFFSTWRELEAKHQAPSHISLGEIGAVLWGLPSYIHRAIADHHKTPVLNNATLTYSDTTALGNQLTHWFRSEPDRMENALLKALMQKFKTTDDALSRLVVELRNYGHFP